MKRKPGAEMCRLYGFRATEETKVECTLVHAQNALILQSASDAQGRSHADGWGLAFYSERLPELERQAEAAFEDLHFSDTAERVFSETVVAHVRLATVGTPSEQNCHPFVFGRWAFAHNGTITEFDRLQSELESETDPVLQKRRSGSTDSEQLFLWLLSRIRASGIDITDRPDVLEVARVVGRGVCELASRCRQAGGLTAKLNVVLTDGEILLATRWNNDLYYVLREGVHDCEICGIPHVHHHDGSQYRAVVIASERISDEPWQEVPNFSILTVDRGVNVRVRPVREVMSSFGVRHTPDGAPS